ncbi:putative intracellular protease/amidase [Pseudaminobacter salicylatoxidans]|uniref:Putative intracellular protease/amidase n=1 Tax=Pseudaminobacter salicylatoxidans TaxID=93369 RepID=A0A316C5M8_PSESE|nr:DJ-1/PfpI family protein [Pseudaminobacter salicylatoxidans]PWJ85065.1 putative intracellular protease/amidase [Pseudaminobacter salicylatoxidans]
MTDSKTIGFVFIDGFADWEYGLLSASASEWFATRTLSLTPTGEAVRSMSGFRLMPDRGADPAENADLDAVAVIGSDVWATPRAPDVSALLRTVEERGGVVGGICAGTLALARAGLFEQADHTSNGRDWILKHEPDYAGAARYRDVPHAVADGRIVSAPGSAPGTFALAFLEALLPGREEQLAEMRALFAREYS